MAASTAADLESLARISARLSVNVASSTAESLDATEATAAAVDFAAFLADSWNCRHQSF